MAWQVRHKLVGVFMGVNHGCGHYHSISECCRGLGVFRFESMHQIEAFFEMANGLHLPPEKRLKAEDFIIEEWDFKLHDLLLDEGLVDGCQSYLAWSLSMWPVSMN